MNNNIGTRVKSLRVGRGMNQTELAVVLGVKQVAVSMIEKGINNPTITQLEILSDYFGVTIDWIVKGVDVSVTSDDRAIINAVKEDSGLYQSITAIMNAKKNLMTMRTELAA